MARSTRYLFFSFCLVGISAWTVSPLPAQNLGTYHDYSQVTSALQGFAATYPDLVELGSLGRSVQGREIWYARITDNLPVQEDEPEFRYISSMHGDEVVGIEMSLYFIDHLLSNYETDSRIRGLINNTDITIVPLMNPDGRDLGQRNNANGYNLNRSFPEGGPPFSSIGNIFDGPPMETASLQPEVQAVMEWSAANRFTLSANFHGGALVVNYPYDNDGYGSNYSAAPDDELFIDVAKRYSEHNGPMWNSPWFDDGITNGAAWYSIYGGLQDWAYRYLGDMHYTIELSDIKWPSESSIPSFWDDNRESMLSFMEEVHIGVRGLIVDSVTGQPISAAVEVADNETAVFSDPDVGDYHRMLLPGTYDLSFRADGYHPLTVEEVVVGSDGAIRIDVLMDSLILAADFDTDGDVDGDDFLTWQSSFGMDAGGDANADGDTDGDDFLIWQSQFGSISGSGTVVVPEPAASILFVLVGVMCWRRRL